MRRGLIVVERGESFKELVQTSQAREWSGFNLVGKPKRRVAIQVGPLFLGFFFLLCRLFFCVDDFSMLWVFMLAPGRRRSQSYDALVWVGAPRSLARTWMNIVRDVHVHDFSFCVFVVVRRGVHWMEKSKYERFGSGSTLNLNTSVRDQCYFDFHTTML